MHIGQRSFSVLIIGIIAFTLLAFAQYRLFEHRMIVDSAVSTFIMCNTQWFDVTEQRFAVGINQVLPVIATYFTTDVKWVIGAYYANDYLWYLGFFFLFLYGFKQPSAALALVVGYFTIIGYNYFVLTYTVPLTWPLLIMLVLVLQRKILTERPVVKWLVILVCCLFLAYSHPVNTIVALLFFAYLAAAHWKDWTEMGFILKVSAIFIVLVVMKNINPDPYDVNRISSFGIETLSRFSVEHVKFWVKNWFIAFPIATLLLPIGIWMGVKHWQEGKIGQSLIIFGAGVYVALVYVLYGVVVFGPYDELAGKAMAPLMLLLSYFVCQKLIEGTFASKQRAFSIGVVVIVGLIVFKYSFLITEYSKTAQVKVDICKSLIAQAPEGGSRYYVNQERFAHNENMPIINSMEVIIASALSNKPYDVHIVVADSTAITEVLELDSNQVYHMQGSAFVIEEAHEYFNLHPDDEWEEIEPIITLEEGAGQH